MSRVDLLRRVQEYADRKGRALGEQLGFGIHGIVFTAQNQVGQGRTAIKVFERGTEYGRERDVYFRLQEHGITTIRGCHVPEFVACDDDLWVVEMTLVARPFVLDFAGAYLDEAPDFSEEVMADWQADKREQFGSRWAEVQAILRFLEGYGVFMLDVNPGNVSFGD